MSADLYFIQPHVLERLIDGKFVPKRQHAKAYPMRDRRQVLSPLNVTRRAVKYEPLVFETRKSDIIQCVEELNTPHRKLLMVSGPPGRGKTAFVRAVVEMMGGGKEQLLWFDVSRHSDFDEVIRFLVDYMTYICKTQEETPEATTLADPILQLEHLLQKVSDTAILIVIDNIESLVSTEQTLRSRELKEAFNFLLSFPNVKLLLSGRFMPFTDMNPSSQAVFHLPLTALTERDKALLLTHWLPNEDIMPEPPANDWQALLPGEPFFLQLFAHLARKNPHTDWKSCFQQPDEDTEHNLFERFFQNISPDERQILILLSCIRHGITIKGLQAMLNYCDIKLESLLLNKLDQTLLRWGLKKVYPPQLVLQKLQRRLSVENTTEDIEAYYQIFDGFQEWVLAHVIEAQQVHLHEGLNRFYLNEKGKHLLERAYSARSRHLLAEAQYHVSKAKRRRLSAQRPSLTQPERLLVSVEDFATPATPEKPTLESLSPEENRYTQATAMHTEPGVPVSIRLETGAVTAPTIQLTQQDLEKLAELILRGQTKISENKHQILPERPLIETTSPEITETAIAHKTLSEPTTFHAQLQEAMAQQNWEHVAEGLYTLSKYCLNQNDTAMAEDCLHKALDLAKKIESTPLICQTHGSLGHLYQSHYQHNQALKHLRIAAHLIESQPSLALEEHFKATVYHDLAQIYLYRQDYPSAIEAFQKSLSYCPESDPERAQILFRLALTWDESGNSAQALESYLQSQAAAEVHKNTRLAAASLYNLAGLYLEQGQLTQAEIALQTCLTYDNASGLYQEVFRTHMLLSSVYEAQHRLPKATEASHEAYQIALKNEDAAFIIQACVRLGELAELEALWETALAWFKEALPYAVSSLSRQSQEQVEAHIHRLQEKAQ